MKKLLLAVALMFAAVGVFADEFDNYVEQMRKELADSGFAVRSDKRTRTIFFDIRTGDEVKTVSQQELAEIKQGFVESFKQSGKAQGVAKVKALQITFVFNIILTNGRTYQVAITPDDLQK